VTLNEGAEGLTNAQVDRLGERLRAGAPSEDDLRLLDKYRRSFADAYGHVVGIVRDGLNLSPTGRPAKSTSSIRDKLIRESVRLSQMQDIAGCRVVVEDVTKQDNAVEALAAQFPYVKVLDRRERPSHGYRAVHLVVHHADKPVEIQVRSVLQHLWAELSEKLADVYDPAIKYGGGPEEVRGALARISEGLGQRDSLWRQVELLKPRAYSILEPQIRESIEQLEGEMREIDLEMREAFETAIRDWPKPGEA
jgi:GTP pyrophosphokinase